MSSLRRGIRIESSLARFTEVLELFLGGREGTGGEGVARLIEAMVFLIRGGSLVGIVRVQNQGRNRPPPLSAVGCHEEHGIGEFFARFPKFVVASKSRDDFRVIDLAILFRLAEGNPSVCRDVHSLSWRGAVVLRPHLVVAD